MTVPQQRCGGRTGRRGPRPRAGGFARVEMLVPAFDDPTHPESWIFGWAHVLADMDPERHGRSSNDLFADGHVASIPAATLRRRLESGENFAVIPESSNPA